MPVFGGGSFALVDGRDKKSFIVDSDNPNPYQHAIDMWNGEIGAAGWNRIRQIL